MLLIVVLVIAMGSILCALSGCESTMEEINRKQIEEYEKARNSLPEQPESPEFMENDRKH